MIVQAFLSERPKYRVNDIFISLILQKRMISEWFDMGGLKLEVFDQIENVKDTDSFACFLNALAQDYKDNHDEWENWSIEDYLKSIAAWINDCEDPHGNSEFEQLDFKELAKIFYVGKIYE